MSFWRGFANSTITTIPIPKDCGSRGASVVINVNDFDFRPLLSELRLGTLRFKTCIKDSCYNLSWVSGSEYYQTVE
ncbi:hypothetical protein SUGI_0098740 [Cryptomeria japonica]|nr:hypothetical protein SUGI_0098740 [Cryptomeria japonica]